jgi:hypothetical protein
MVQLADIPFLKSRLRLASISSHLQTQTVSGVMRICELQKRANLMTIARPKIRSLMEEATQRLKDGNNMKLSL